MLSKLIGAVLLSLDGILIEVEVEHRNGFPGFDIVGLPDAAVKESRDRVMQSIRHSGYDLTFRKILCNLAPADIKKTGTTLDLPIAIGILMSSGVLNQDKILNTLIVGELGFEGQVRPISGALSLALMAKKEGIKNLILPDKNKQEVALLKDLNIFPVASLKEAVEVLEYKHAPMAPISFEALKPCFHEDFNEVKGQAFAKRALEISAAGFHNILMMGSPGVGKTMLAKRLRTIMTPLSLDEAMTLTQIYSVAQRKTSYEGGLILERPFRTPHHTASDVSITGGGSIPKPGEITLAHHGILFLDEFPEFKKNVFEALREPLEDKIITVSRAEKTQQFPAHFLLVAAMNPCPCGYLFHPNKECICSTTQRARYYNKISGPILDRIDIHIQMAETQYEDLQAVEESSDEIRERIRQAVWIQQHRFQDGRYNAQMSVEEIQRFCSLPSEGNDLLKTSMKRFSFSMRSYNKILSIARTIADLEASEQITLPHLLEAFQYRNIEKVFSSP